MRATRGGGTYGTERIVRPENWVVVGVVRDATTPEALGKPSSQLVRTATWNCVEVIERLDAEFEYDEGRGRHTHDESRVWIAWAGFTPV